MNYSQSEIGVGTTKVESPLGDTLEALWHKVRAASELVAQLKADKHALSDRLAAKEQDLAALRNELSSKEHELKRLRAENLQLLNSNGNNVFSNEDREILRSRIRDLIAKINSHL